MTTTEPIDDNERWSEVRQAYLPPFEAFLYRQRAGLSTAQAVEWWERYVFSSEAAEAIAAGRTIDEEASRRDSTEPDRTEQRGRDRAERDRLASDRDFLAGLSSTTAALVRQVTKVGLDAETDYPCEMQVERAADGQMVCTHWDLNEDGYVPGTQTESDATFGEVLQFALDSTVYVIDIGGLDEGADVRLLSTPEYWPTISRLLGELGGEPLYLNGETYAAADDRLVHDASDD